LLLLGDHRRTLSLHRRWRACLWRDKPVRFRIRAVPVARHPVDGRLTAAEDLLEKLFDIH
jgi:hypothetical protein